MLAKERTAKKRVAVAAIRSWASAVNTTAVPPTKKCLSSLPPSLNRRFRLVQIAADGNCFYRAVSFALFKTEKFEFDIRVSVVSHIVKFWNRFSNFLLSPCGEPYLNAEQYRKFSLRSGEYASSPEIQACCEARRIHIRVHSDGALRVFGNPSHPAFDLLFTGPIEGGHFDFLQPLVSSPSTVRARSLFRQFDDLYKVQLLFLCLLDAAQSLLHLYWTRTLYSLNGHSGFVLSKLPCRPPL